jgi:hypothetical protein
VASLSLLALSMEQYMQHQAPTAGLVLVTIDNLTDVITDPASRAKALEAINRGCTVHANEHAMKIDAPRVSEAASTDDA